MNFPIELPCHYFHWWDPYFWWLNQSIYVWCLSHGGSWRRPHFAWFVISPSISDFLCFHHHLWLEISSLGSSSSHSPIIKWDDDYVPKYDDPKDDYHHYWTIIPKIPSSSFSPDLRASKFLAAEPPSSKRADPHRVQARGSEDEASLKSGTYINGSSMIIYLVGGLEHFYFPIYWE